MKLKRLAVSPELLLQALHVPEGTKLHSIYQDPKYYSGALFLVVENDAFHDVVEGCIIEDVVPIITRHDHVQCGHETYTWDWRIDEA